jgi:hypothetical protein
MKLFVAMVLAALILLGFTFIPHFDQSVRQMQRFTHTSRGFVALIVITSLFAGISKLVFVDLWAWRETRGRRKDIPSA